MLVPRDCISSHAQCCPIVGTATFCLSVPQRAGVWLFPGWGCSESSCHEPRVRVSDSPSARGGSWGWAHWPRGDRPPGGECAATSLPALVLPLVDEPPAGPRLPPRVFLCPWWPVARAPRAPRALVGRSRAFSLTALPRGGPCVCVCVWGTVVPARHVINLQSREN